MTNSALLRSLVSLLLITAACLFERQTAWAFNASSVIWKEGRTSFNVNFAQSGDDDPNDGQNRSALFQQAFVDALDVWNTTSTFQFDYTTASAIDPCSTSSGNGVRFDDDDCGDGYGSATLAVQTAFFSGSGRTRTYITFNNTKNWGVFSGFQSGLNDFYRVAVHELGHSIGLGHEDVITPAVMRSFTSSVRDPQTDDLAGVAFMYDADNDNVGIAFDNCPEQDNPDQADLDDDDKGDACDDDIDGDGVFDTNTIDQSYGVGAVANSRFSFGDNDDGPFAQSFRLSQAASVLELRIPIDCDGGTVRAGIQELNGQGLPNGTYLVSRQLNGGSLVDDVDGFVRFSLNATGLSATRSYALVLNASNVCYWYTASSAAGSYAAGSTFFFSQNQNRFFAFTGVDLPFQVQVAPPVFDNCPTVANPDQTDSNTDGVGDACDDLDNDNVFDGIDNCPNTPNPDQANFDADEFGDDCDDDIDNDGVLNGADSDSFNALICQDADADNCDDCANGQVNPNNDGPDSDGDGICNLGEVDDDDDGVLDDDDNCPTIANPDQSDSDENGIGDICEDQMCLPVVTTNGRTAIICL